MLRPLHKRIAFIFCDEVSGGRFNQTTESGLYIHKSVDKSLNEPRWGKVLAVGPDVEDEDIKNKNDILIENLRWTEGFKHDGIQVWFTDEKEVIAVRTETDVPGLELLSAELEHTETE